MIRINLLPVREWRRKEAVRQQISIFFLSIVLLLSILFGVGMTVQGKVLNQRQQVADLENRKAQLAYVNKKIEQANRKQQEVEEKFKTIEQLQEGRTLAVMVLDEIVTALPLDRVWLTKLTYQGGRSLALSGIALDNHTVALFMRRLGLSDLIGTVNLANTRRNSVQNHDLMEFDLQVEIRPPAEKHEEKETQSPTKKGVKT